MHAVELSQVTKRFGHSIVAVDNIDLVVPTGAFVTLLGPSGCGKTTTLRMIAGLESPSAGEIRIKGQRINELPIHKRNLGIVFQNYALFPHKNIAANVGFGLKYRDVAPDEIGRRVARALDMVRLPGVEERYPAQLSGGQQQRIALARSLITNPRVLLLDEPLSALDEFLRLQMRGELRRIQDEFGITFIHVTHTQMEAIALADMVVVMDQGQIEQAASAREVYDDPRTSYVARFMGGHNVLSGTVLGQEGGAVTIKSGTKQIRLTAPPTPPATGTSFEASVRRDHVRLNRAATAGDATGLNAVSGRVAGIEYQGTWLKITIDEACGEEFVANVPDNVFFADPLKVGDAVLAQWNAEDVHFLDGHAAGPARTPQSTPATAVASA